MMTAVVALREPARVARPLPVLIPLIQDAVAAGNRAGLEHYRRAGEMLLEARAQVAPFKWTRWLSKHFTLSRTTAFYYMKLAERVRDDPSLVQRAEQPSVRSLTGQRPAHARWRRVLDATRPIEVVVDVQQARTAEVHLHRDLALEVIESGYRAWATRLHPDHGGSLEAMRRLNRVRDDLKAVAATRHFD